MDKTLARLASFIHDSYPESHPLSARSAVQFCIFVSTVDSPASHCPLFRLFHGFFGFVFWSVKLGGGGGWFCTASGSPSRIPALYGFRCSLGLSLFVQSYSVLLSILYFLRLLAAVPLCQSGGLRVSVLGATIASPVISV